VETLKKLGNFFRKSKKKIQKIIKNTEKILKITIFLKIRLVICLV